MAFKMRGSAFKLNNIATKSALKQSLNTHSKYTTDEDYAPKDHLFTEGKGKKTRFKQRKGSTGSNPGEVMWIRDNYGTNLSKSELRNAQASYYNTYGPQMEEAEPESEQQYTGQTYEKETQYPTHKQKYKDQFGASQSPDTDLVWDETVNKGKGGYVRKAKMEDEQTEIPDESSKYSF